jgi:hypothetical protein
MSKKRKPADGRGLIAVALFEIAAALNRKARASEQLVALAASEILLAHAHAHDGQTEPQPDAPVAFMCLVCHQPIDPHRSHECDPSRKARLN